MLSQGEANCINCNITLNQAECLWDDATALWCTRCYDRHHIILSARGVIVKESATGQPVADSEAVLGLEKDAVVIWNSMRARNDTYVTSGACQEGLYYGLYTKMWAFSNGDRITTAHMSDGRIVKVGKQLPLHTPTSRDVATQTNIPIWYYNKGKNTCNVSSSLLSWTSPQPFAHKLSLPVRNRLKSRA